MYTFSTFICFINKNSTKKRWTIKQNTESSTKISENTRQNRTHKDCEWQEPPLQHSVTYCFTNVYIHNYHVLNNNPQHWWESNKAVIHHMGFLTLKHADSFITFNSIRYSCSHPKNIDGRISFTFKSATGSLTIFLKHEIQVDFISCNKKVQIISRDLSCR